MKNKLNSFTKKAIGLLMASVLIFSLTACAKSDDKSTSSSETTQSSSEQTSSVQQEKTTIVDREGLTITIPEKVEKIISLSPSATETLINLGLEDKIIAIDEYSKGLGLPQNLPAFSMMEPNTEQIIALKPDLVIGTAMSKTAGEDLFKPVLDAGVLMTFIPTSETIASIKEDIAFIGEITKTADKAKAIVDDMTTKMDKIVASIKVPDKKIKVYFENSPAPSMYSFGKGTFLNEMIEMLGAENILADQNGWVSVTEEVIIAKNPDVILTNVNFIDNPVDEIISRESLKSVNAMKEKRVHLIDANASSRPNENILKAFEEMANAIYARG